MADLTPAEVRSLIQTQMIIPASEPIGEFHDAPDPPSGYVVPERDVHDGDTVLDPEGAHEVEDEILLAVLLAIAEGRCTDPAALARAALEAAAVPYYRWYS